MLVLVYTLLLLVAGSTSQQIATINLREPADSTIFALRKHTNRTDAAIKYDIDNLEGSNVQICMQLDNSDTREQLLQSTCFAATGETKTLVDLPIGKFILSMVLRDSSPPHTTYDESRVTSKFTIAKISDLLPKIDLSRTIFLASEQGVISSTPNEMTIAAVEGIFTNVQVEYELGFTTLQKDIDNFDVGVKLVDARTDESLLKQVFVTTKQKKLTFQAMSIGIFKLTLYLAEHPSPNTPDTDREIYENTAVNLIIYIKSLSNPSVLPKLTMTEESKNQNVTLLSQDELKIFNIDFTLNGLPSALDLVQPCVYAYKGNEVSTNSQIANIEVDGTQTQQTSTDSLPILTKCSVGDERTISLELGEGIFDIKLILRQLSNPDIVYDASATHTKFELNYPVIIIPEEIIEETPVSTSSIINILKIFSQSINNVLFPQKISKEKGNENENKSELPLPSTFSSLRITVVNLFSKINGIYFVSKNSITVTFSKFLSPVFKRTTYLYELAARTLSQISRNFLDFIAYRMSSIYSFFSINIMNSFTGLKNLNGVFCAFVINRLRNLLVFLGLDYFTEAKTPTEFFIKCAQLYMLFFIVSIVYFQFRDLTVFQNDGGDKNKKVEKI